jgi:membrane protease YdiL (CAAX protease family)
MPSRFPKRRPLVFVGLLLLLILGVLLIAYAVNAIWHGHPIVVNFFGESLLGLTAVFLLSRFRWWRVVGFRTPQYSPAFWCLLAPCFVLITDANTVSQYWNYLPGHDRALLFLILAMLVGFVEETYFRGLILRTLLQRGPWLAAIISSILFGGLHLLHLIEGQNLVATLSQAASASALGFLFAAVALRTRSILPLIVIHGLTDFIAFLVLSGAVITYIPSADDLRETAVEAIIFILLGVIAMRGIRASDFDLDIPDRQEKPLVETAG